MWPNRSLFTNTGCSGGRRSSDCVRSQVGLCSLTLVTVAVEEVVVVCVAKYVFFH